MQVDCQVPGQQVDVVVQYQSYPKSRMSAMVERAVFGKTRGLYSPCRRTHREG